MKLPGSEEMRAIDACAIEEYGIPGMVLMENAGSATVRLMEKQLNKVKGSFALIFIGPGNNGGDGLVIGRHLHQLGCEPIFFFLINPDNLTGDAATNLTIVKRLRLPLHVIDSVNRVKTISVLFKQIESRGKPCCAIVDAIFGTGLVREIKGHYADAIELINTGEFSKNIPVIAVDTPSGLDSNTGKILGTCVKATMTATFGCAKPGQIMQGSSALTGKLWIVDIGIPPEVIEQANITTSMITADTAKSWTHSLIRDNDSHKGTYGHLLILAGSAGKTGAAILAAKGALRTGCGLVSLCVPYDLNSIFETSLAEAMTIPLPTSSSLLNVSDISTILRHAQDKQAIVLGPGLGDDVRTVELVLHLYQHLKQPVILDADALNIIAKQKVHLQKAGGPRIFTPHPGEMGRLVNKTTEEVLENRLSVTQLCHSLYKNADTELTVILKGAGTLVFTEHGHVLINTSGNPGMATGGMGDVLSGMIGSFICQGLEGYAAAGISVYLHGLAGDMLYNQIGQGFTASELADKIPVSLKNLQESK